MRVDTLIQIKELEDQEKAKNKLRGKIFKKKKR
jgi:hypothetical protein